MDQSAGSKLSTNGLFFVVVFIAATNYVVCKWALETVPPLTLMAIRYLLATLLITLIVLPRLNLISRELLGQSFSMGCLLTLAVVSWQFGILAAEEIGPGAFIVSMDGLMVPLMAFLLFRERLRVVTLIALPLAVAGLGLLNLKADMSLSVSDSWFLASAVAFALHIVLTHRYARVFDAICLAWGQLWVVALICLAAAIYFERDLVRLDDIIAVKYEVLYLAIVATAFRFSLQNYVQKITSATTAGFLFVLEPVMVTFLGWWLLSERMNAQQLLGCGLIFIAVLLSQGNWKQGLRIGAVKLNEIRSRATLIKNTR